MGVLWQMLVVTLESDKGFPTITCASFIYYLPVNNMVPLPTPLHEFTNAEKAYSGSSLISLHIGKRRTYCLILILHVINDPLPIIGLWRVTNLALLLGAVKNNFSGQTGDSPVESDKRFQTQEIIFLFTGCQ